jgi:hypothetical protein
MKKHLLFALLWFVGVAILAAIKVATPDGHLFLNAAQVVCWIGVFYSLVKAYGSRRQRQGS